MSTQRHSVLLTSACAPLLS